MAQQVDKSKVRVFAQVEGLATRDVIQSIKTANTSRANIQKIIDAMLRDPTVNSILCGIKEDFTQAFEDGRIIKSVSPDPAVQNAWDQALVNFDAEGQIGNQIMILMSYGELYGQMFTIEALQRKLKFLTKDEHEKRLNAESLEQKQNADKSGVGGIDGANKNVLVQKLYTIDNPLEFYDVRYLGETIYFYRQKIADANTQFGTAYKKNELFKYSDDILIHEMLYPAIVKESMETGMYDGDGESVELKIERGVGMLETAYPAFVNLMLGKAAMLIARDARSVVITLLKMNRDGMTDEEAEATTDAILEKISARRSLNKEEGVGEYTNSVSAPAVVMVTKEGETGDITAEQIGGDYDAGSLNDIANLEEDFYGAFRTVKQKFGKTGDAAGFSGGESMQLLLDSYAQMGGYIQQVICRFWERVINKYFESKGFTKFVDGAKLQMKKMPTSAETDKENLRDTSIRLASQVMSDIDEKNSEQLKIYRTMLNRTDLNNDIIELIDEIIEKRESEEKALKEGQGETDFAEQEAGGVGEYEDYDEFDEEQDETLPPMGGILNEISEEGAPTSEAGAELPDMLKVVDLYDRARASMKKQKIK